MAAVAASALRRRRGGGGVFTATILSPTVGARPDGQGQPLRRELGGRSRVLAPPPTAPPPDRDGRRRTLAHPPAVAAPAMSPSWSVCRLSIAGAFVPLRPTLLGRTPAGQGQPLRPVRESHRHVDPAPIRELGRVGQQVVNDLKEPYRIAVHDPRHVRIDHEAQRHVRPVPLEYLHLHVRFQVLQ